MSGEIGRTRLSDRGSVSGGLRLGRRWLGGEPDFRSIGPWARAGWRFSTEFLIVPGHKVQFLGLRNFTKVATEYHSK